MAAGLLDGRAAIDAQRRLERREIDAAPVGPRRSGHEGTVRHEIRQAVDHRRVGVALEPRVDYLDRGKRRDRGGDLVFRIRLVAARQVALKTKCDLDLDAEHRHIRGAQMRRALQHARAEKDATHHLPVHDAHLPAGNPFAQRRDGRVLNRMRLRDALRPRIGRKRRKQSPAAPCGDERARSGFDRGGLHRDATSIIGDFVPTDRTASPRSPPRPSD